MAVSLPTTPLLAACGLLGLCVGAIVGRNVDFWGKVTKRVHIASTAEDDRQHGCQRASDVLKEEDDGTSSQQTSITTPPPSPSADEHDDDLHELMRHKLDVLVVFSAGHPILVRQDDTPATSGGLKYRALLDEYEKIGDQELYLGAPERFLAASRIAPYADVVVVLAGVQPQPHDPWDEVRAIMHVLCEEYKAVPRERVVGVVSEATTMGGMWALKQWVNQYLEQRQEAEKKKGNDNTTRQTQDDDDDDENTTKYSHSSDSLSSSAYSECSSQRPHHQRERPRIGLLTGFYHVPRVMRFVGDLLEDELGRANFIPLAAEAFLPKTQPPLYAQDFAKHGNAFLGRWKAEYGGLGMFEVGGYRDQDREHGWMCEVFTADDLLRDYM